MIPSGKRLHNYGKSLFLMGKSTINGHFMPLSIAMFVYQRVNPLNLNLSLPKWEYTYDHVQFINSPAYLVVFTTATNPQYIGEICLVRPVGFL